MGRSVLLDQVRDFWMHGRGVASLVGIGGAGKTTLLKKVIDEFIDDHGLDGVLVWSFYDDPDTNAFLKTAVEYIGESDAVRAQGAGWFHALKQALDSPKRFLIILDGLERVQRPITDAQGVFGELEDPLLRGLLVRLASGIGSSKAIVTSRFPISDLERWNGNGHIVLNVDQLDAESAVRLIRSHGVEGTDSQVQQLSNYCGGHALTLDLMGAAVKRFFDGNASSVLPLSDPIVKHGELQTARLTGVLKFFDNGLTSEELDLMSRLCVFRFGVSRQSLSSVFLGGNSSVGGSLTPLSESRLDELILQLVGLHLVHLEGADRFSVHPAVRDHFYGLFRDASFVHEAIGEHLTSLTQRPGVGLPTGKESLDLLEELVYHSLKSGAEAHAFEIYSYRMGGGDHLNITLGEYARTYRIISAFPTVPDPGSMYHCLRAFGKFEEALKWRPRNRYIAVLSGQLTALRDDPDENTRKIARLLRGESHLVPDRAPDHPLSSAHLHLLVHEPEDAASKARADLEMSIHQDDMIRNQMALAEALRQMRRLDDARLILNKVSPWVLQSSSSEHLATLFLFRARQEMDGGSQSEVRNALEEALEITLESKFVLLEVEVRCEWARFLLKTGLAKEGLIEARHARTLSSHESFGYTWGEIRALAAEVDCLKALGQHAEQVESTKVLIELLKRVDSPDWQRLELGLRKVTTSA